MLGVPDVVEDEEDVGALGRTADGHGDELGGRGGDGNACAGDLLVNGLLKK